MGKIPLIGTSRISWEKSLISMIIPTFKYFSKGKALINLKGPHTCIYGKKSDMFEGFVRTFLGAAFYLHDKNTSLIKIKNKQLDLAALYKEGICNGTNKQHPEYWGNIKTVPSGAKNIFLIIGLMLTKKHIWNKMNDKEREYVLDWLELSSKEEFYMNNWQWFKVFNLLFLEKFGRNINKREMNNPLKNIEKMYVGDGWYSDSLPRPFAHFDYYVPWTMHFCGLLFSHLASKKYNKWKKRYRERAKLFTKSYQNYFTPNGHPPLFGRSQIYRFAYLAPFGVAMLERSFRGDINWIKTCAVDTINTFIKKGTFDKKNIMTQGYYKTFTKMLDDYSGPGSPYWAFEAFSFLLLSKTHKFWKTKRRTKPKKGIFPLKKIKTILVHDGESEIKLLNAGSTYFLHEPIKYNKFAYSNKFLPNFDKEMPVDNMLLLENGGEWSCRENILDSKCDSKTCEMVWHIEKAKNIMIKTILIARPEGYIALHKLIKGSQSVRFRAGGFVLSQDKKGVRERIENKQAIINGKQGISGINILYGIAKPSIYKKKGINPAGSYSAVPYLEGSIKNKGIIAVAVWTGEKMSLPSIMLKNNFCKLSWQDEKLKFRL